MTTEHKKSQEHDEHISSKRSGANISKHGRRNILFFALVFLHALGFFIYKTFLPRVSESVSVSEPTVTTGLTSQQQAAGILKKEVLGIADGLVAEYPSNEGLRMFAVEAHLECLNYNKAKTLLEEGIRLNPWNGDFYERTAYIALFQGEHDKIITCLKKTLEISPERSDLNIKIAEAFISLGKYSQAIGQLQKYIKIYPESASVYYLLGQGYLQLKKYDESKKYFEKAIEIQPNHHRANYGLATVYMRSKQRDKAQQYMEVYRKWQENKAGLRKADVESDLKGTIYDTSGRNLVVFSEFLAKLCIRGSGLYKASQNLKKSDELLGRGKKVFEQVIRLVPKQADVYRELALIYVSSDENLVKAKGLTEKAVSLDPTAQNYFVFGMTCMMNSDRTNALSAIERAMELDPDNLGYRQRYNMIKGRK